MRFIGSVPSKVKNVIAKELIGLKDRRIQIIGSGSFTIEQILQPITQEIYSNDISLLSVVFGDFITNTTRKIKIVNKELQALSKYENRSALDNAGIVLTIYGFGEFSARNNLFSVRMFNAIMDDIESIFEKNKQAIKSGFEGVNIREFYVEDAVDVIQRTDDKIMISFLPTYTGGYEKLYRFLDKSIEWDIPDFTTIDEEKYIDLNGDILKKGGIVYTDREIPEFKEHEKCYVELGGGMKGIRIYSSVNFKKQAYLNKVSIEDPKNDYLSLDDVIDESSNIEIVPVKQKHFEWYRNVFIAKDKVRVFGKGDGFVVLVDKKVCGFLNFKTIIQRDIILLVSDFAVGGTRYKRLSKLIIMLSRSTEISDFLSIKYKRIFNKIITKVYTSQPVSMKYRGEFKKVRNEKDGLIYESQFGDKTSQQEKDLWVSKHSKK